MYSKGAELGRNALWDEARRLIQDTWTVPFDHVLRPVAGDALDVLVVRAMKSWSKCTVSDGSPISIAFLSHSLL